MRPEERRAFEDFKRQLRDKREADDRELARMLERAWSRALGLPDPEQAEALPEAVADLVDDLRDAPLPLRHRRIAEIIEVIGELQSARVAAIEAARVRQENDALAAVLLLAA